MDQLRSQRGLIRYRHFFNRERVVLVSPKAHFEVLSTKTYDFQKPPEARVALSRTAGHGILVAEGEEHKRQRKNLMPAFKYQHVRDLYPVFWEKSNDMVNAVTKELGEKERQADDDGAMATNSKGSVLDFGNWLSRCTLDIIGVAAMGVNFDAINDPNNDLNQHYRRVFAGAGTPIARFLLFASLVIPPSILRMLPLKRNEEINTASDFIRSTCRNMVKEKMAKMAASDKEASPVDKDILSVALESGGFTTENLVDQMMTFLAAGHETTSTATGWALLELAQRPELQAELRKEIRAQLPSPSSTSGVPLTADLMDRSVPLLHAVCNEVLRYHAPVPITRRVAVKDTTILNHPIPKGTTVFIVPWAVNFSKEQWGEDALEFKHERWLGDDKVKAHNGGAESPFSNMTFLHGPRSCIGMGFAKAEIACLLAAVLGRFEFEMPGDGSGTTDLTDVQTGVVARPRKGVKLRVRVVGGW